MAILIPSSFDAFFLSVSSKAIESSCELELEYAITQEFPVMCAVCVDMYEFTMYV